MKRRFRKSIPLSRERQFYIMGVSLDYRNQPEEVKGRIDALCRTCCPDHAEAFRRYVTSEAPATAVIMEWFIASNTTLDRAVRKYFVAFDIETRACEDSLPEKRGRIG